MGSPFKCRSRQLAGAAWRQHNDRCPLGRAKKAECEGELEDGEFAVGAPSTGPRRKLASSSTLQLAVCKLRGRAALHRGGRPCGGLWHLSLTLLVRAQQAVTLQRSLKTSSPSLSCRPRFRVDDPLGQPVFQTGSSTLPLSYTEGICGEIRTHNT